MMRVIEHLIETIETLFFRTHCGPRPKNRPHEVERFTP